MLIIGADYHPTFQQIAFVDTETGELQQRRLDHPEAAEKFYRDLAAVLRQNVALDKRIVFYLVSPLRFGIAGGFDGPVEVACGEGERKRPVPRL